MNRCNKPTPYHLFFLSHHTFSCWPHCTETCTNLYHEDQMLLLAGLHLLHLHVHVITTTTHLRTGRGGAMMGRAARPLDAALCPLHHHGAITGVCRLRSLCTAPNTAHILCVTDQSAGVRGRGGQRSICTDIVLAWYYGATATSLQQHFNSKTKIAFTTLTF